MRIFPTVFTTTSVLVTIFACGGSSGDGSSFVAITPTTMQALAGSLCSKTAECLSDVLVQAAYGSAETCRARVLQQFQLASKGDGYGISEQTGAACNTALGSVNCQDLLSGIVPDVCKFTGTLADGTSCADDAQCVSGSCFVDDTATCGKCGPRAALGADCTNSNCERGLKCGSDKKCTNGNPGSPCGKQEDCRILTACREGTCKDVLQEGAACTNGKPESIPCDLTKALFCVENVCKKAAISVAGTDEKCGLTSASPLTVTLCNTGECSADKCRAWAADGAACTTEGDCQDPAKCRNGKCALKDPLACK